jgi:hypothetical protein
VKDKKIKVKGVIHFILFNGYIETAVRNYTDKEKELKFMYPSEYTVYDLMSGEKFADAVEAGSFIDYDGSIAQIFVNGYVSNLGIWDHGIHQGEFCVGLYDFRNIRQLHISEQGNFNCQEAFCQ